MRYLSMLLAFALLLGTSACGTTNAAAGASPLPADFLNPQAPQAGRPFPYNSPWCP